jgi:hypothetical protein
MTILPATIVEAEALAFARRCIAWVRDGNLALGGIERGRWFEKNESHRISRQMFKAWAMESPINRMNAVEFARAGWALADEALRELILEYLDRREPLPTYLAAFAMEVAAGVRFRRMPARRKSDNVLRDIIITFIVCFVSERFALRPTRNREAHRRPSACSIVTDALRLEGVLVIAESGINKIWERHSADVGKMSLQPIA